MTDIEKPCVLTIVHMGDSITFGQYVDAKLRWTSLVADRLHHMYLDTPVHIHSLNRGVSGETTRQGLEHFSSDVQHAHPDILTLQFGLNDCNCWLTERGLPRVSEAAFRANLIAMINRARRFDAQHIILANNHKTLRSKVMLSGERYEDANARYSELIHGVAIETGVVFCDMRKTFTDIPADVLATLLLPYPDQLHLSQEGHRVYADALWPYLLEAVTAVIHKRAEME